MSQDAGTGRDGRDAAGSTGSTGSTDGRSGGESLDQLADDVERSGQPVVTDAPGDDQADDELDARDSEYEAASAAGASGAAAHVQDAGDGRGEDALTDR